MKNTHKLRYEIVKDDYQYLLEELFLLLQSNWNCNDFSTYDEAVNTILATFKGIK